MKTITLGTLPRGGTLPCVTDVTSQPDIMGLINIKKKLCITSFNNSSFPKKRGKFKHLIPRIYYKKTITITSIAKLKSNNLIDYNLFKNILKL